MSVYVWMGVGEREEVREGSDVKMRCGYNAHECRQVLEVLVMQIERR